MSDEREVFPLPTAFFDLLSLTATNGDTTSPRFLCHTEGTERLEVFFRLADARRSDTGVERKKRLKPFGQKACSNWPKGLRVLQTRVARRSDAGRRALGERLKLIFSEAWAFHSHHQDVAVKRL